MSVLRLEPPSAPASGNGKHTAVALLAHEIRTPLTAIIGMAEVLRDSQLSPDQREMIEVVGRSAQGLVDVVSGVLDLAKLEAGKLELERRPFLLADCVEECIDLLAATAARKRVDLAHVVDAHVPARIRGDATRLRQVLINLVGNALKFTQAGEVVVSVTTVASTADRSELRFAVADSGPGIPADRLATIFEPFTQADASTGRRYGGTGLGLPIARQLVTLMGGRLWVESEVGEGSSFYFTVPTEVVEAAGLQGVVPDVLAGRRLLVVEDNATIGGLLAQMAGRWGVETAAVTDAESALTALRERDFDLILIDGEMPGVAGRSVASLIGSLGGRPMLPMVLMTTLNGQTTSASGMSDRGEERFAAFVTKPVKSTRLHAALVRACDGATAEPALSEGCALRTGAKGAVGSHGDGSRTQHASCARGGSAAGDDEPGLNGLRVLVADDDSGSRRVLERLMKREGIEVLTVSDGSAALDAVRQWGADILLLDGVMPGVDGFEVCRQLKADPATMLLPVVMVTGLSSRADRLRGVEAGADGFLPKPFDRAELLARVRSLARTKRVTDRLERAEAVLVAMARCIEGKDPNTHGHCERLSDLATRLARRIGLDVPEIEALRLGGIVHDIGKVAIPDSILLKPSALDVNEWDIMRTHPVEGERICRGLSSFRGVLPIIRHHHEKQDGSGYPDGLRGDAVPMTARVLQVVDVYDALTTTRPYKSALASEGALEVMASEVDLGWWDPAIFAEFQQLILNDRLAPDGTLARVH